MSSFVLDHTKHGPVELLYRGGGFPGAEGEGGMSPVLFPIVGRLYRGKREGIYVWRNRPYKMALHGFAKDMEWEVVEADVDGGAFVRARLRDTEETRRAYPFAFEYTLTYRLFLGRLHIELEVESEGPFSVGFHPYFRTPPIAGL